MNGQNGQYIASRLSHCIKEGSNAPKKLIGELLNEDLKKIAKNGKNYIGFYIEDIIDSQKTLGEVINKIVEYMNSYLENWNKNTNKVENLKREDYIDYKAFIMGSSLANPNTPKELIEKLLSNSNEEQRKNIVCYYDNSNILKLFVKDKNKRISDLAKKKLKVNKNKEKRNKKIKEKIKKSSTDELIKIIENENEYKDEFLYMIDNPQVIPLDKFLSMLNSRPKNKNLQEMACQRLDIPVEEIEEVYKNMEYIDFTRRDSLKLNLIRKMLKLIEISKILQEEKEIRGVIEELKEKREEFKEGNEKLKEILTEIFKNINKSNKEYMTNLVLKFMQENGSVTYALVDCIKDGVKVPKKILKELVNEDLQEIAGEKLNYSNLRANLIFGSEKTSGEVINIILNYMDSYWQKEDKPKNLLKDSILSYKRYLTCKTLDVNNNKYEQWVVDLVLKSDYGCRESFIKGCSNPEILKILMEKDKNKLIINLAEQKLEELEESTTSRPVKSKIEEPVM